MVAVAITRQDLSAAELRREAARSRDAKAARRMLALALVLDGQSRGAAAEACGMDRQTLRDWVHRYMCGCPLRVKLRVATMAPRARVRSCVRPPSAAWAAAGPDELRGARA